MVLMDLSYNTEPSTGVVVHIYKYIYIRHKNNSF